MKIFRISRLTWNLFLVCAPALLAVFLSACALLAQPRFAKRLDDAIYDAFMTAGGTRAVHPAPAIVDIDETSLEKLGQWPWPRNLFAALIENIFTAGAAAVGIDVLQHEADGASPVNIARRLKENFGATLDLSGLPPELLDNDTCFRDAIVNRPVVLGAFALLGDGGTLPEAMPKPLGVAEKTPAGAPHPRDTIVRASGLVAPLPSFGDAAFTGIINATLNEDGAVRSTPLLVTAGNNIYAGLSVRTLLAALGKNTVRLISDMDGLTEFRVGDYRLPVGHDGSFRPVYRGPSHSYPYFSAADVLSGKIGEKELAGRIIFIGSSATGLRDIVSTPFDPAMPGVETHATIVDNILSGESIRVPPWATGFQLGAILLLAACAAPLFAFLPAVAYAPLALCLLGGGIWGAWELFDHGLWLSPLYDSSALLLTAGGILPLRFWKEERGRRQIKRAFSRYVSPEVVSRIAARGGRTFEGEQKEVSILFTDVRGFTSLSEKLAPDQIVRLLNKYFTPMTRCVIEREGTLDKFIGDALMAFWNAPLDVRNHQVKAVSTAIAMQETLKTLREEFKKEFGVEMYIGAGINCGLVHVGNMGSQELLDYTCIGDNVNLASRLEGLCKRYGVGIVISGAVRDACGQAFFFRLLDRIRVKGKSESVRIYTPLAETREADVESAWEEALTAYFMGDFANAAVMFSKIGSTHSALTVACRMFCERCDHLTENPPQAWDGVWTYDSK